MQCALLGGVAIVATGVRVAPLVEGGERLRKQCVSEDGYLMLTIARSMAIGNGMSYSDGTIPSNGVQPLATLIYSACFWLTGGHKYYSLYAVVGVQVLIAMSTAALLYLFVARCLYRGRNVRLAALIAAIVWYASPTSIMNTQNSLETGLYAMLILVSVAVYDTLRPRFRTGLSLWACLLLGVILGLTFLARNDACFLIATVLVIHLSLGRARAPLRQSLAQSALIGATSVAVASPWLWHNITRFGHIVPISGRSETLHVQFGHNLLAAFPALFENALLVLRIPSRLQQAPYVVAFAAACCVTGLFAAVMGRRWLVQRYSAGMGILACFAAALFVYYSFFFGMPSFLGRYFFPAVAFFAILAAGIAVELAQTADFRKLRLVCGAVVPLCALACIALNVRIYAKGDEHLHFQVVNWVKANVPETTWVAATQTGTLGYYHDRTINLDGKVDPNALAARTEDRIPQYLIEKNVEYIADWVGHAEWAKLPAFAADFELIVRDPGRNLAVLRRRHTPAAESS